MKAQRSIPSTGLITHMKPTYLDAHFKGALAALTLMAGGASAQLTLDLATPSTTTHGTVTFDFTLDPDGTVSAVASASNNNGLLANC